MVPLRDAASLIVLKPDGETWRILMGLRNAHHKFLPNHMVFPGGGVDAEDYFAEAAEAPRADTMARLMRSGSRELAAALCHAAARELVEETGLSLGSPPALGGLHYICRAETPGDRPIRFNARFFVAASGLVQGTLGGSGELEMLDWYELDGVMKLDLALATRVVLGQLKAWLTVDDKERTQRKAPVLRDRVWLEE